VKQEVNIKTHRYVFTTATSVDEVFKRPVFFAQPQEPEAARTASSKQHGYGTCTGRANVR
jgi:hypothetical protein